MELKENDCVINIVSISITKSIVDKQIFHLNQISFTFYNYFNNENVKGVVNEEQAGVLEDSVKVGIGKK